ncbi:MAG: hypothetical protein DI539_31335 [Flavobacterium psychrophilum]|nr:MAG: hypothetical protein DI539_31335 [Flavobacterium psychrophilum]
MLAVGDGITDDVLQEHLQDTTGLLVDQARDTLDATTTGQTADSRLGDALDVVTKNLKLNGIRDRSLKIAKFYKLQNLLTLRWRLAPPFPNPLPPLPRPDIVAVDCLVSTQRY